MSKEIYISSTPHETRLAIVENDALTEIYYERENEYTLAGSIYNGKVTRVLPGMQSSFVDIGLERDAFLYITDFMEEAPDSAEFETSSLGNGSEGSRENGHGREARVPRLEGQAAAQPQAPPQAQQREGSGRSERGGRGRGRGDRSSSGDRASNGERQAVPESFRPESAFEAPRAAVPAADEQEFAEESAFNAAAGATESAEIGEGAPGADGGRRWRGRRGRRRGRGPVVNGPAVNGEARDESPRTTDAGNEQGGFAAATDDEGVPESGTLAEHRIDAAESADPAIAFTQVAPAAPVASVAPPATQRLEAGALSEGRRDRAGQDRGTRDRNDQSSRDSGRGRDRNDRGRGDREGRGDRPARVPRGFEPSRSLYGVDSDAETEAPAEPIILPGESLSKYRKGGEEPARTTAPAPVASTEYTVAPGWDGGSVLPGESLSRHRGSHPETRPETRSGGRVEMRSSAPVAFIQPAAIPTPERAAVIAEPDGLSVAVTPETQPEIVDAAHLDQVPDTEILHEVHAATAEPVTATESLEADHTTLVKVPVEGEPGTHGLEPLPVETKSSTDDIDEAVAVAEYEPEEGFASYRVDPIAPSEYRQSAPAAELEPIAEPELVAERETASSPTEAEVLDSLKEQPGSFASTHFLTPEPIGPEPILPTLHEADAESAEPVLEALVGEVYEFDPPAETPLPGHDVTTLNPMGEMISLPAEPLTVPEPPEPNTPVHPPLGHETAVIAPMEFVEERVQEFELDEDEEPTLEFAPGSGDLEEELIEEEEFEVAALHASYDDEMDDLEEETLEGAADLGTMLREMSIDQITRTSPEGEEEEFEEDSLEESGSEETGRGFEQPDVDSDSEEYRRTAAATGDFSNEFREPAQTETASGEGLSYNERRGGRRDIRRGGRDRDRSSGRGDSSGRARNTGGGDVERGRSDQSSGRSSGRTGRSMQSTNLPAISDLLKPGQEILVQIAKEPMAKKGARITSHIALPGRFLVFMPTVNHTGVSRKIESDGERRRLKEILLSEKGEAAGGFIVRTAASGASEEELRSDLRFLLNLWADIKNRSESSKSPALIYHDLNLVERILRDQVTDTFSAIWVDSETEYERVLRFLQRFQPSLIRRVKLYSKETPLFEQFGITEEINKALRSKVWLKSGGSIVINQTEALVAIDINTGKFVGKTARLEDTIVKTNLDAIPEIVRQIRLRDLGGIIIIDFIDMDERKNRNRVMAALEEELKSDRAPSKVLQFNDFGLVAITRKRVKQSLERTLSTTCGVCQGTGMTKSPVTVCNDIYVEMKKMHKHMDKGDVMLRVHPEVVKQLKSSGTRWLQEMEEMSGKTILVKSDPSLHPEQFDIH